MSLYDLALPLVRFLPPEAAHTLTILALKRLPARTAVHGEYDGVDLSVVLPKSGLAFANPVGLAAGFDKNGEVANPMLGFGFGFVECGTVTPRPQAGNPKPRLFRLTQDRAVINRMGFNNKGLEAFVRAIRQPHHGVVGANVGANKDTQDRTLDDITGLNGVRPHVDYITINISSPNTPGLRGLQDEGALKDLLGRCGAAMTKLSNVTRTPPVFLKIAPDLTDEALSDLLGVVEAEGDWLAGLIVSNTTLARPDSLASAHKTQAGGLSGAPLLDRSTDMLRAVAKRTKGRLDLIGVGGISSGADAYAKLRAGAHAVQLYSALVYEGPGLATRICTELAACLKRDGFTSPAGAVGADL